MIRLLSVAIVFVLASPLAAAEPEAPDTTEQAEINLLRRTVERQKQEIAELRQQVAALKEQITSSGIEPATTTQPAEARQRLNNRVIFIRTSGGHQTYNALLAAVRDLEPTQYFNYLVPRVGGETRLWESKLVPANNLNKARFEKDLKVFGGHSTHWLDAVGVAAKWRPDVIWLVGSVGGDEEQVLAKVKEKLRGTNTRVNTSKVLAQTPQAAHLLWRISQETGGVCVDEDGQPIGEPTFIKFERPTPPPPKNILREAQTPAGGN